MRVEVARHFGGPPFAPPYSEMDEITLFLLYAEVKRHEREAVREKNKDLERVDVWVRFMSMIANPKIYKKFIEMEQLKEYEAELTPEQVQFDFESLKDAGLEFLEVVEEPKEENVPVSVEDDVINAAFEQRGGFEAFRQEMFGLGQDEPFTIDVEKILNEE